MEWLIAFTAVLLIFGTPFFAMWTGHQRKMLEMRLQMQNQGDSSLRTEVEALRQEVRSLRDTSMQYDLSFDTALQRMEKRVEGIERRGSAVASESNTINLGAGR